MNECEDPESNSIDARMELTRNVPMMMSEPSVAVPALINPSNIISHLVVINGWSLILLVRIIASS